jgi:hypothetical protein
LSVLVGAFAAPYGFATDMADFLMDPMRCECPLERGGRIRHTHAFAIGGRKPGRDRAADKYFSCPTSLRALPKRIMLTLGIGLGLRAEDSAMMSDEPCIA